jgi:uncharacterized protein (TIGR00730 family)
MNIGVFCSQYEVAEKYKKATEELGKLIAADGHTLVWGGADEGLMGLIAHTVKDYGAKIVGVMREALQNKALQGADEMHVVPNAYEMNMGIINRSDVIMVLVGGIGTLNEVTEIIRMNKNGQHAKKVIFINTDGFYDGFMEQMQRMAGEGFVRPDVVDSVSFFDTPAKAMAHLA